MDRNCLSNHGDDRMLKDTGKDGRIKNTMSFEGRGFKNQPMFMKKNKKGDIGIYNGNQY
jgi:hypothetical protein